MASKLSTWLVHDALIAVEWFESNYMKINRKKCHILITGKIYEHIMVKCRIN